MNRKPDPLADSAMSVIAGITARRRENDRRGREAIAQYESMRPPALPPITPPPRETLIPST